MATRDYGLFMQAESLYEPGEREQAESSLATQKGKYESEMDKYYTGLAAELGMFEKELGWKKEKFGQEFGLEEEKFGWEKEKFGETLDWEREKFGEEMGFMEEQFEWEQDKFGLEQEQQRKLEMLPFLYAETKEWEKEMSTWDDLQSKMRGSRNLNWLTRPQRAPQKPGVADWKTFL